MSRNSYRALAIALVLIVSLGIALPAGAAGRADRDQTPAAQHSLLARLWDWVGPLWPVVPKDGKGLTPVTAAAGICDPDRGVLIDPNGQPCNK